MDFLKQQQIMGMIGNDERMTMTTMMITSTATTLKRKRKIYMSRKLSPSTAAADESELKAIRERRTAAAAAMSNSAMTPCSDGASAAAAATRLVSGGGAHVAGGQQGSSKSSTKVCLLCRQHVTECCMRCCQQMTTMPILTTTTTKPTNAKSTANFHAENAITKKNRRQNAASEDCRSSSNTRNHLSTTTITTLPLSNDATTTRTTLTTPATATAAPSPAMPNSAKVFQVPYAPLQHVQRKSDYHAPTITSTSSASASASASTSAQQYWRNWRNSLTSSVSSSQCDDDGGTKSINNNNNNNQKTKSANKFRDLFEVTLRTLQFVFIHVQMCCAIFNKSYLTDTINHNHINNHNNNNNNSDNNNAKTNTNTNSGRNSFNFNFNLKRQQRPPLPRLKFRHNSYANNCNSANNSNNHHHQQQLQQQHNYNINANANTNTNTNATLSKYQQNQRRQQNAQEQEREQGQQTKHCRTLEQLCNFKLPKLSLLYMLLLATSSLSLFLPATHAQTSLTTSRVRDSEVRLSRNETVCKTLDIRNTPDEFRQLRNCTVIEGFLLITLVNTHAHTQGEFTETFPLLTEVTEFILIYRIHNLRSLSQIFPNLSIIRGRTLFEGYALTVYSNPHLEDLGLSNLMTISRGGVRIENNLRLCFVQTVDWSRIVSNTTDIVIESNRAVIECPQCPGDAKSSSLDASTGEIGNELICKEYHGHRNCWNSRSCQKICPERCRNNCRDENTCCNEACIGGCTSDDLNVCTSCRFYSIYNNSCTDKCPRNYYSYLDRRCLTAESCARIGTKFEINKQERLVPYNGVCSTRCPEGYNKIDGVCKRCGDKCTKQCTGGLIDSVARAKEFHGCTHIINEGLTISIKRGGRHLMEDLEFGLSSIEVIGTFLKVHGTFGMFSLKYFKNLKTIKGDSLCEDKFALYVLENNDLETIWGRNQTVHIEEGRVFFHFNPKLCYAEIEALRPMMRHNATFDKNEVATGSNGDKGACNTEFLNATIFKTAANIAIVDIVNPLKFEDERTFIGYQYFYIEDPYRNATKHGYRLCDDGWSTNEPTKETRYIFTSLQPFTQYAYYVKTMTISSEPRNAQSPIQYFKTKSAQPMTVRMLTAYANSSSEIVMNWQPPLHAYGNLTKYKVRALLDLRNQVLGSRNFCKEPLKEAGKIEGIVSEGRPTVTQKPLLPSDCKCEKNKDGNYDDDYSKPRVHDRIDFENMVQNFVYVKPTNESRAKSKELQSDLEQKRRRRRDILDDNVESFLLRHMRALPDLGSTTTVSPPNLNSVSSYAPNNVTRMDPNGDYYEVVVDVVNASTTEYVFTKLKHFSIYGVGVEACREPEEGAVEKECSDSWIIYKRTLDLENVDKVENLVGHLETTNSSRSNIRLHWEPPVNPNGAVVSYTIAYLVLTQDAVEEKRCITEKEYNNLTNGYLLLSISEGNYSIRVRANSLAGEGVYSAPIYVNVPPPPSYLVPILVICGLIVLLLAIGVVFYFKYKKPAPRELKIFPTVNPYYISLQYIPDEWEVSRDRVIQLNALGQGSFGMVYEGILKGYNNSAEDTACAIKTVNENATDRERMNFLNEASVMKQFDTYHVVRLLGVCSADQPALVVMELMKRGDLKSYLRAHRPDEGGGEYQFGASGAFFGAGPQTVLAPPLARIYQMAIEIADGMAYLSAKKFVHRDLAARNCMVAEDLTVKIGDFGMTRDIYETDYYRKGTKGLLPVRWMAPESLRDGVYSSASDVFSYGVVLWEMATLASQPYQGLSNDQVLRFVIDGGVMERPENCPDKLYHLMQKCWHHRQSARPSFMKIIAYLMDVAEPHFSQVSFYHTREGEIVRAKELAEHGEHSDPLNDADNDMDDVTTPLRVGEYNDYKLTMENNDSSVEHVGNDSPIVIDEDQPHSPYSLGSANIISSTPDGHSKNSYNPSQMSHMNPTALSSVPSTSAGISGRPYGRRFSQHPYGDEAAYVQPDFEPHRTTSESAADRHTAGKSVETDERGYEIYDPGPVYRKLTRPFDDKEPYDESYSYNEKSDKSLLPRQKAGSSSSRPRIVGMLMSSSVPDAAIGGPMSSSLHPSTASAASSNGSSTATTTAAATATSKYPSLKKAGGTVLDTLMPARLRNMNLNRRFFQHKRTGSNASHKSTNSNPNASSTSSTNLTNAPPARGKSTSGQLLGTIESGGSGSAGSYCPAPRFFAATTSDNPNYKLLDETANASCISAEIAAGAKTTPAKATPTSKNHKHRLEETLTPTKGGFHALQTSENPNYESMFKLGNDPPPLKIRSTENPNYIASQPATTSSSSASAPPNVSENPNYQVMGPVPTAVSGTAADSQGLFDLTLSDDDTDNDNNSSSDNDYDDDDNDNDKGCDGNGDDGYEMKCLPLDRRQKYGRTRGESRSGSQTKTDDNSSAKTTRTTPTRTTPTRTTPTTTTTTVTGTETGTEAETETESAMRTKPSTAGYSLKEKWLRQQQAQPPPPPPNGFIGREA